MQDDQRAEKLVYSCVANLTTPHDPGMRIVSVDGLDVRFSVVLTALAYQQQPCSHRSHQIEPRLLAALPSFWSHVHGWSSRREEWCSMQLADFDEQTLGQSRSQDMLESAHDLSTDCPKCLQRNNSYHQTSTSKISVIVDIRHGQNLQRYTENPMGKRPRLTKIHSSYSEFT